MTIVALAFLHGFSLRFLLGDFVELESDFGVEVILLHLDDRGPVEPTGMDGGEGDVVVEGCGN